MEDPQSPSESVKLAIGGTWWSPRDPNQRYFGQLTILGTGKATLELKQAANRTAIEVFQDHFSQRQAVSEHIHGLNEHGKEITLFNCVQNGHQKAAALTTYSYNVATVLVGIHCANLKEFQFDELELDFKNLQEWLCTPFLKPKANRENSISLKSPPIREKIFKTKSGFDFVLQPWFKQSASVADGFTFSFVQLLRLRFKSPTHLEEALETIHDLQRLLSLAMHGPAQITEVSAWLKAKTPEEGVSTAVSIFQEWPGSSVPRDRMYRIQMLFTAPGSKGNLGRLFDSWRRFKAKNEPVLLSYFSTEFNRHLYSNHRFLFLAHALELYHQFNFEGSYMSAKAYQRKVDRIASDIMKRRPSEAKWTRDRLQGSNRKTFGDRIKELLDKRSALLSRVVSAEEVAEFATLVKNTRNYYTHYDESLRKAGKVAEGETLWKLEERIRAILEVCILSDLRMAKPIIGRAGQFRSRYIKAAED